jgi:hypothetical protein
LHCFLSFKFSSTSRRTSFSRFSTYACTQTDHLVKIIELKLTQKPFISKSTTDCASWDVGFHWPSLDQIILSLDMSF